MPALSTPVTSPGPSPASPTRSSSATRAPRISSCSASRPAASTSPGASPTASRSRGRAVPVGALDVTMYRDDLRRHPTRGPHHTVMPPGGIDGKVVVLVDDVLYSGRTVRAALDALNDLGRPDVVRLAVLVDRGHRELPIRADHVGKNLPSAPAERVMVRLEESDGYDEVAICDAAKEPVAVKKHLLSIDDLGVDDVATLFATAAEMHDVQRGRSRSCRRCAGARSSTCSSRTPPAPARPSRSPASGSPPTSSTSRPRARASARARACATPCRRSAAMGVDGLVIRHMASGAARQVSRVGRCAVINAGDGTHEHPTQALLDAYTLQRRLGYARGPPRRDRRRPHPQPGLPQQRAAARQARRAGHRGGAAHADAERGRRLVEGRRLRPSYDLDEVLPEADAVMMLRVQRERMSGGYFPSAREYTVGYGLTRERLGAPQAGCADLPPRPDEPRPRDRRRRRRRGPVAVLDQVSAGVAVRMSVLYHLLAGEGATE